MINNDLLGRVHKFDIDESFLRSIETSNLTFKRIEKSFYEMFGLVTERFSIRYNFITSRGAKKEIVLVCTKADFRTNIEVSGWIHPKKTNETMKILASLILKIAPHVKFDGKKDTSWCLSKDIEHDIIGD